MTSTSRQRMRRPGRASREADPALAMSILDRRDVAFVPLMVVCVGAFALALSEGLRPPARPSTPWADDTVIVAALLFGIASAVAALLQDTPWGERTRGRLWIYLGWSALLLAAMTAAALLDQGLASVSYNAVILLMPYVGLVFPRRWSRVALAIVLASALAVTVLRPDADLIEAGSTIVLIVSGWFVGLIPRLGHYRASRQALLLSRSDTLTGTLNRRGFFEHADWALGRAAAQGEPVALLVIDLNGFKLINDAHGHAAGDELLAWVGRVIPQVLPESAALGRLGGDEFAVFLDGVPAAQAIALGTRINVVLAERVGASIGIATAGAGLGRSDDLLREADGALYAAKADPAARVKHRAFVAPPATRPSGAPAVPEPAVSYQRLRRRGPEALLAEPTTFDGLWVIAGFSTIAAAGATFVASTIAGGGDSLYQLLIIFLGVPWVLANLAAGVVFSRRRQRIGAPDTATAWFSVLSVGLGVGCAALSTGEGAASPILAGLYLKVLFDATTFERRRAQQMTVVILVCWAVVLVLGPPSVLWVAPFQAVLLLGAYFIGSIGREAFNAATEQRMHLASTDPLTGLLNRRGFARLAQRALDRDATAKGTLAIIALDLDAFKQVNDTHGHAVGDRLLQAVANVATSTLQGAEAVGRLGGDEFVAAIRVPSRGALSALVQQLDERLAVVSPGSVGAALQGSDGETLEQLVQVADHRAYATKQTRAAKRLTSPVVEHEPQDASPGA